jgi:hypothetical protein
LSNLLAQSALEGVILLIPMGGAFILPIVYRALFCLFQRYGIPLGIVEMRFEPILFTMSVPSEYRLISAFGIDIVEILIDFLLHLGLAHFCISIVEAGNLAHVFLQSFFLLIIFYSTDMSLFDLSMHVHLVGIYVFLLLLCQIVLQLEVFVGIQIFAIELDFIQAI